MEKRPRRLEHVRRHHGENAHAQRKRGIHGGKIEDHDIGLKRTQARAQTRQQTGGMHQLVPVPDDVQLREFGSEPPDANFRISSSRLVLDEHVARTKKENPYVVSSRAPVRKCAQHVSNLTSTSRSRSVLTIGAYHFGNEHESGSDVPMLTPAPLGHAKLALCRRCPLHSSLPSNTSMPSV